VTDAAEAGDLAKVCSKFISGGHMQLRLGIWQRFYYKFISDGKMQLRLEVWQMFITSL